MIQEINYTEYIERYLQNHMSKDERIWFEKELEGNLDLQAELDFHKKIDAVLSDRETSNLKSQLDKIHQEINVTTKNSPIVIGKMRTRNNALKGVVMLLFVGVFLYISSFNYSSNHLLSTYYQPEKSMISFRSASDANSQITDALGLYEKHEYNKAIELFEMALKADDSQIGVNLYAGVSYMELQKYDLANKRFQKIIDLEPNPFVESASWYMGLCYLFTEERDKAKEIFIKIADSEGMYKSDAKKIVKRL